MSDLESIAGEAKGFVAAQVGRPFNTCPTLFVSREEMAKELSLVATDLLDNREEGGSLSKFSEGIERQIVSRSMSFFSKRILGLYSQRYFCDHKNRILIVQENVENTAKQLGIDADKMLVWVVSHEMMHGAQFNDSSPLKEKVGDRVVALSKEKKINKDTIAEIRAWMTWIEGSADFVMDRPGLLSEADIKDFRAKMNQRREARSWSNFLLRLLGNKGAQYIEGARLIRDTYPTLGAHSLSGPIEEPGLLPTAEEISDPLLWEKRLGNRDSNPD